jgi:hypothetical protein
MRRSASTSRSCTKKGIGSKEPIPKVVVSDESFVGSSMGGAEMWKPEDRRAAERRDLRYPSDLTDAEWELFEPMISPPSAATSASANIADRVRMPTVINPVHPSHPCQSPRAGATDPIPRPRWMHSSFNTASIRTSQAETFSW